MPSNHNATRQGHASRLITAHMTTCVRAMALWGDSLEAARRSNLDPPSMKTTIRNVEAKIGYPLFARSQSGTTWKKIPAALNFFLWCETNMNGGKHWPRVAASISHRDVHRETHV